MARFDPFTKRAQRVRMAIRRNAGGRARLSVHRSGRHIYAQVIDDTQGVTEGFTKVLEITGVGYRAQAQGRKLRLQLGYSHDVNYDLPEGVDVKTPDQNTVEITGIDKQKVGQVAAEIRRWRKPEPYKGKGIKYRGEFIFRKEGKKK